GSWSPGTIREQIASAVVYSCGRRNRAPDAAEALAARTSRSKGMNAVALPATAPARKRRRLSSIPGVPSAAGAGRRICRVDGAAAANLAAAHPGRGARRRRRRRTTRLPRRHRDDRREQPADHPRRSPLVSNQFATPSDVFSRVNSEFQSNPSKAAGTNAVYQFDLSGDNGGQYHIIVKEGQGEAGQGAADSPNITISMAANDFVDLANGKLDGTMAFMSG